MEIVIGIFLVLGIIGYVLVGIFVGVMGAESYGKDGELRIFYWLRGILFGIFWPVFLLILVGVMIFAF